MKEFVLIPKYMYEQLKNVQSTPHPTVKKRKLNTEWKTPVPPIPLRTVNVDSPLNLVKSNVNNTTDTQPSEKLPILFKNGKLTKAKQLLKILENKSDYISGKDILGIIKDFLSPPTAINEEKLQYYNHLIYNLNIPSELVLNRYLKSLISNTSYPTTRIKGGTKIKWEAF